MLRREMNKTVYKLCELFICISFHVYVLNFNKSVNLIVTRATFGSVGKAETVYNKRKGNKQASVL